MPLGPALLDALKLLALAAMTVDHVNAALFARSIEQLTLIGRIAFPVFVFAAASGALRTRSPRRYLRRLLLCALVSQPVFWLALDTQWWHLNTVFTLLLGVGAVLAWRADRPEWLALLLPPALLVDYGLAGVAAVPAAAMLLADAPLRRCAGAVLFAVVSPWLWFGPWQLTVGLATSAAALLLLARTNRQRPPAGPRYAFYVYYPLHLALLALVKRLAM